MDGFVTFLVIAVVVVIVIAVASSADAAKRKEKVAAALKGLPDFTPSQEYINNPAMSGVAIDEQRGKVAVVCLSSGAAASRIIKFRDIISSELYVDGSVITKTVRSSQIGGALVGGVLLGGVGAVIGGLSGKTKTSEGVRSIDLRLTINDTSDPIQDINFLKGEIKRGGLMESAYQDVMTKARHWHALIEVLIKRADAEDKSSVAQPANAQQAGSVADELKKLVELRDSGVLTPEEFQQQKSRLLGDARHFGGAKLAQESKSKEADKVVCAATKTSIPCPSCGAMLSFPLAMSGKSCRCPRCANITTLTTPECQQDAATDNGNDERVLALLRKEGRLAAIKLHWELSGKNLSKSKDYVDALARLHGLG